MAGKLKTPEDRNQEVEKLRRRVKKQYKVNVKTRRRFEIPGEESVVKEMALVLKLANYSNSQIAAIVGVSKGQVKDFVADPKFQNKLLYLKERLPEAALELGRAYLIEAVQAVAHVMRTSKDEAMVLKAAGEIFDRFGLAKLSRIERKNFDPLDAIGRGGNETTLEQFRVAPPEIQEEAAQLFDMFEQGLKVLMDKATGSEENSDAPNNQA
jgi:hypothetical protein